MVRSIRALGLACAAVLTLTGADAPPDTRIEVASIETIDPPLPIEFRAPVFAVPDAEARTGDSEIECLAVAVYHEARGEPRLGQLAVAQVVVNRARSGRFARTLCGVVAQPGQFPFKTQAAHRRNPGQWERALAVARQVSDAETPSVAGGALYFHAARVAPGWRRARVAAIGNHIFYR